MFTKTYIFNLVLNNLGVSEPIQSENDNDDPRVILLSNYYNMARDTVLEQHDWKFASKYQSLALAVTDSPDPNFLYAYNLPNDCISPRALISEFDRKEKKFELATDTSGQKIILSNYDGCLLRYTKREVNESLYSAPFVSALAFYLAYLSAQVITGSANKKNTNLQDYQLTVRSAILTDANKMTVHNQDDKDYTDFR